MSTLLANIALMIAKLGAAIVAVVVFSGCNQCEALEEKLCDDLGAEDCKIWRESNGTDILYSGRRSNRFCFNARFTGYDPLLQGARAHAAAMKAARNAAESRQK